MTTGWVLTDPPSVAALTPYDLRCEHRVDPLGIGSQRPAAELAVGVSGARRPPGRVPGQRAARRRTGVGQRLADRRADIRRPRWRPTDVADGLRVAVWRSATRRATKSRRRRGSRPASSTRGSGRRTGSSTTTTPTRSSSHRWTGRSHGQCGRPRIAPPRYYRRSFELAQPVARARVYATAHGLYQLSANGQRVGTDELTPGWTDYRERLAVPDLRRHRPAARGRERARRSARRRLVVRVSSAGTPAAPRTTTARSPSCSPSSSSTTPTAPAQS